MSPAARPSRGHVVPHARTILFETVGGVLNIFRTRGKLYNFTTHPTATIPLIFEFFSIKNHYYFQVSYKIF